MAMPKVGTSLAAASPALVKFGAKFLDKGVKWLKPWARSQEYAPIVTAVGAFGLLYTNRYTDLARSVWDGSISLLSDTLLSAFYKAINPNNPGNPGNKLLTEGTGTKVTNLTKQAVRSALEI